MMFLNYRSKKELKEQIGSKLDYDETSFFGKEYKSNGTFTGCNRPYNNPKVMDMKPKAREFFATVSMENDLIQSVK